MKVNEIPRITSDFKMDVTNKNVNIDEILIIIILRMMVIMPIWRNDCKFTIENMFHNIH